MIIINKFIKFINIKLNVYGIIKYYLKILVKIGFKDVLSRV